MLCTSGVFSTAVRMVPDLACGVLGSPAALPVAGVVVSAEAGATAPGLGGKLLVLMPSSAAAAEVSCRDDGSGRHGQGDWLVHAGLLLDAECRAEHEAAQAEKTPTITAVPVRRG